ncbi:phage virion morphogenesis protein [uncultured Rikenella sp.]|uniref:phage virion morphogenesis protein n=1 Tax=uncultured Rikenella sp. TaxID=368003 RepID=UPI002633C45A|nr:phage virion morphogenesis protein [uncultured Rikenella sp.]
MGDFATLRKKIAAASEQVRLNGTRVIAETATEYYKQRFTTKEWEGEPWPAAKNPPSRGSLMVRSGALVSTIRPARITPSEATIRAGSPRVPYARIHNEGGTIEQKPTPKQRRFFWAKAHAMGEAATENRLGRWERAAVAKQLHITIPRRKFIGKSVALNRLIVARLRALITL